MCGSEEFGKPAKFYGTTKRYRKSRFDYAVCKRCGSITNLTIQEPDYSDYVTGKGISDIKVNRFVKLIKQMSISKSSKLLDYGCGNGALINALNKKGYNVSGYDPYNKGFCGTIKNGNTYSLVFMTHVFEHVSDYKIFFSNLKKLTKKGSLFITINPTSTRMKRLNPKNSFQNYNLHAPFHVLVPSDKAQIELFRKNGFKLKKIFRYDIERSGIKDNSRVSAILTEALGGTKEAVLSANKKKKALTALSSPFKFFYNMFINTKDCLVTTFVFERI